MWSFFSGVLWWTQTLSCRQRGNRYTEVVWSHESRVTCSESFVSPQQTKLSRHTELPVVLTCSMPSLNLSVSAEDELLQKKKMKMLVSCFLFNTKPVQLHLLSSHCWNRAMCFELTQVRSHSKDDLIQGFEGLVPPHLCRLPQRGDQEHVHLIQRRAGVLRHHPQTQTWPDVSRFCVDDVWVYCLCRLMPGQVYEEVRSRYSTCLVNSLLVLLVYCQRLCSEIKLFMWLLQTNLLSNLQQSRIFVLSVIWPHYLICDCPIRTLSSKDLCD